MGHEAALKLCLVSCFTLHCFTDNAASDTNGPQDNEWSHCRTLSDIFGRALIWSFHRIIPNGCWTKLWALIGAVCAFGSHIFDPPIFIWGLRLRDLSVPMTETYKCVFFPAWQAVCCSMVNLCKSASASCNPTYLHPLVLITRPRKTGTSQKIRAGLGSQWWEKRELSLTIWRTWSCRDHENHLSWPPVSFYYR